MERFLIILIFPTIAATDPFQSDKFGLSQTLISNIEERKLGYCTSINQWRKTRTGCHMSIFRCFVLMLLISSDAFGLEARLFIQKDSLFLILVNDAPAEIAISKNFILGECEGFANICLVVTDEAKNEIEMLSRPMNFDIFFKDRFTLHPSGLYGMHLDKEEVVGRFDLNKGNYDVIFIYRDRKSGVTATSNSATLIVGESSRQQ